MLVIHKIEWNTETCYSVYDMFNLESMVIERSLSWTVGTFQGIQHCLAYTSSPPLGRKILVTIIPSLCETVILNTSLQNIVVPFVEYGSGKNKKIHRD